MEYDTWNIVISRINGFWLLNVLMLASRLNGHSERLALSSGFSAAFKKKKIICVSPLAMFSSFGRVQLYF